MYFIAREGEPNQDRLAAAPEITLLVTNGHTVAHLMTMDAAYLTSREIDGHGG